MFIDERLPRMGDESLYRRLEVLGNQARRVFLEPDAGIWEYRGRLRIHTHSATMCWVALDRLARIAMLLGLREESEQWRQGADGLRKEILARAWSKKRGAIAGALDHDDLDASVLLLPELGLLAADDQRYLDTCEVLGKELGRNGFMMRYTNDDFGAAETSFLGCLSTCSRGATRSASCRRISIHKPVTCGEICRRPTPWPGSSTHAGLCRGRGRTRGPPVD
jgi:GH15 family glucan-1,4-alpha-glucosidase